MDTATQHTGWKPFHWTHCPIHAICVGLSLTEKEARDRAGLPVPAPFVVRALLDTGANTSFAVASVFARLGSTPTGEQATSHAASAASTKLDVYLIDLWVPATTHGAEPLIVRNLPITKGQLSFPAGEPEPRYELVLGCDVLRYGRFTIDGPANLYQLEKGA